jgi:hypothetical protein
VEGTEEEDNGSADNPVVAALEGQPSLLFQYFYTPKLHSNLLTMIIWVEPGAVWGVGYQKPAFCI